MPCIHKHKPWDLMNRFKINLWNTELIIKQYTLYAACTPVVSTIQIILTMFSLDNSVLQTLHFIKKLGTCIFKIILFTL